MLKIKQLGLPTARCLSTVSQFGTRNARVELSFSPRRRRERERERVRERSWKATDYATFPGRLSGAWQNYACSIYMKIRSSATASCDRLIEDVHKRSLSNDSYSNYRIFVDMCSGPAHLKGRDMLDVTQADLNCGTQANDT
ncbi:hypothetical protein DPMN_191410 [Dreissena polymorpha]|uniref:Uncharacterized protein n=1 Tax=Dreissena polymorpha TaxID=45954 RepID=A0A9D3Y2P6_DREPO|nr:hypothetical protein DPMN_191410 [Dreissena polymorpha]